MLQTFTSPFNWRCLELNLGSSACQSLVLFQSYLPSSPWALCFHQRHSSQTAFLTHQMPAIYIVTLPRYCTTLRVPMCLPVPHPTVPRTYFANILWSMWNTERFTGWMLAAEITASSPRILRCVFELSILETKLSILATVFSSDLSSQ